LEICLWLTTGSEELLEEPPEPLLERPFERVVGVAVASVAIALERVRVEPHLLGDPLERLLETEALGILHHVDHIVLVSSRTPISHEAVLEVGREVAILSLAEGIGAENLVELAHTLAAQVESASLWDMPVLRGI